MRVLRAVDPLYVVAAVLFVLALLLVAVAGLGGETGQGRSGSVYDTGSGGTGMLRSYLDSLGFRTRVAQGDRFAPRETGATVLFLVGASDPIVAGDVEAVRAFVQDGGTAVVATDGGFREQPLLSAFGLRVGPSIRDAVLPTRSVLAGAPPATSLYVDIGRELVLSPRWTAIAGLPDHPVAAMTREGRGTLVVVGSIGPFTAGSMHREQNARFAVSLAAAGYVNGAVAFDEFHHGIRPSPDLMAVLERTWVGRATVFAAACVFLFLLLTGRRLGPPLVADPRPPRSSLDYVRGFAGLVRRSGHGELVRERLRAELRRGLAALAGMDPASPFDRVLAAVATVDRARADEARALDLALGQRLRDDQLLRSVPRIEALVAPWAST